MNVVVGSDRIERCAPHTDVHRGSAVSVTEHEKERKRDVRGLVAADEARLEEKNTMGVPVEKEKGGGIS